MVGVGDEARHHPQHCEGLNLQVSGVPVAFGFIQCHQSIALLVDIQVFHKATMQEMVETPLAVLELADVVCCHPGDTFVTDDQWAAHPAASQIRFVLSQKLHCMSWQQKHSVQLLHCEQAL